MAQLPADNNDYDMAKFFNPDGKTSMVQKDNKGDHQEVNPADALSDASVVCVYFSAHWCPACDMWTTKPWIHSNINCIVEKKLSVTEGEGRVRQLGYEDQDTKTHKSYFGEMGQDWFAYKWGEGKHLSQKFGVQGIPMLVVLDAKTGAKISQNGRADVMANKEKAAEVWLQAVN